MKRDYYVHCCVFKGKNISKPQIAHYGKITITHELVDIEGFEIIVPKGINTYRYITSAKFAEWIVRTAWKLK